MKIMQIHKKMFDDAIVFKFFYSKAQESNDL